MPHTVFDLDHYTRLNVARDAMLRARLPEMRRSLGLATSVDVGCGVGYFSSLLREMGFQVVALDGRPENAAEARRRNPEVECHVGNVEDSAVCHLGPVDLVLCLGLLYHLENPLRAIRNLYKMTGKVLVIESMCLPGEDPAMILRDESPDEAQGLRHVAFYPTEAALVKMLYRAGFRAVYRFQPMPNHEHFRATLVTHQVRTMLIASRALLSFPFTVHLSEPATAPRPWDTTWARALEPLVRLRRFWHLSWGEKGMALRKRLG